ncbi:hypothetical protein PC115_g2407 [Phytophthora cactorum]|uniref:DUF7769 domain-containing protein n=1 Tax=Phytophthora cactorum TaxID=29920 RepID=A0A8T1DGN9_9STRA|nr:hypothetical protein PC115_g2407 [Phytophthora cactorum]KAG3188948.1 hypothetical protein C6341_g2507 [Phytophthora cactorum]
MPSPTRRRELSDSERDQVVVSLLQCTVDEVPRRGAIKEVAAKFRVDRRTISRVWKKAKVEEARSGQLHADYSGNARGRPMLDLSEKLEKLRITPFDQRSTLCAASSACGVARATLQRRVKGGQVVAHVSNVKPLLTDENKAARSAPSAGALEALHHEGDDAGGSGAATLECGIWLLLDGKLGIWPFIVQEPAVRSSSRRPAGTMITKEGRVNKGTYRKMLIQHLLPAVRERWPSVCSGELLRVQQDNALAHISPMDTQFVAAAAELGLSIELCCQPPNSPDLNCLDLGLFSAIQARQRLRTPRSIEELVEAVKAAYWELPPSTINAAFLSL